jgi:murein DD-endopeptidase MepM/ murein hydrolase activator NlpD
VQAIGSGTVIHAGWKGGGGKTVILRHPNAYTTYYMHLSRILVRPGQRVAQGQSIGLVGMTGLATGPHLDFRVQHQGVFENFEVLRRKLPPADPVRRSELAQFTQLRDQLLPQLAAIQLPVPANQVASK